MRFELDHPALRLALVYASGVEVKPSPEQLIAELRECEQALQVDPTRFDDAVRSEIRDVLRRGGYKPTGRGKPASEFLLGHALGAGVPRINVLVDINNLVSLRHALPISVFDADRLGPDVAIRFARAGENYVFNASGQSMELAGLPVVCRGAQREAVGNAVKDSMACKVHEQTRRVLYVVYGSRIHSASLQRAASDLARLLRDHLAAQDLAEAFVPD